MEILDTNNRKVGSLKNIELLQVLLLVTYLHMLVITDSEINQNILLHMTTTPEIIEKQVTIFAMSVSETIEKIEVEKRIPNKTGIIKSKNKIK